MKVLGYEIMGGILVNTIHKQIHDTTAELELTQFGNDIWFTDSNVAEHTDNTKKGYNTVLCVIQNDRNASLYVGDKKEFLNGGKIIRFDGNLKHYAFGIKSGRMSFIIWDVPISKSDEDCVKELRRRIKKLNQQNGKE